MPKYRGYSLHKSHPLTKFYENTKEITYTEDGFKVRTLCLTSMGQKANRDHVFYHFSAFGVVESVDIFKKPPITFGFVTFLHEESATKAISAGRFHEIAGHRTKVVIADSWHQKAPERSVDLPVNKAIGKNILDLNDDCLYEMFSLKFVNIMGLCSIAETCTRLKEIANQVFKTSLKICHLGSLRATLYETRRMLINFGPLISELWIGDLPFENARWLRLMYLVITFCGNTLDSLHLNDCHIPEHLTAKLSSLICNLRKLSIDNCIISGASSSLFTNCGKLVELEIRKAFDEDMGIIFECTFPKLLRFECEYMSFDNDSYVEGFEEFISRHTKLKALSITTSKDYSYSLAIVAKNCKQLEKLQVKNGGAVTTAAFEKDLMSVITLTHLKELRIHCANQNVTKFARELSSLNSLEILEFYFARTDSHFLSMLSHLKKLKVLRLTNCYDFKNLNPLCHLDQLQELSIKINRPNEKVDIDPLRLIRHLFNLKTLILKTDTFKMDKTTYLKVVSVVRERSNIHQQTLQIECDADNDVTIIQSYGNNRKTVNVLEPQEDNRLWFE